METSRTRAGASGVAGGGDSVPQRVGRITRKGELDVFGGFTPQGEWRNPLRGKRLEVGDSVEILATGGGGWGDPLLREPERVLEDFLDEYVTLEEARQSYGVVIEPQSMKVDRDATERERAKRRAANGGTHAAHAAAR